MTRDEKLAAFRAAHVAGAPLTLWTVWDAGSARAVAKAGAVAVGTGSWSMAAAQGFSDGEEMPLDLLLMLVARISASVAVPLTVDFETGYAADAAGVGATVARLIETGAVGLNLEDRVIGAGRLRPPEEQAARIAAARSAGDIFINARTDVFFQPGGAADPQAGVAEVLARARIYAAAGADGLFVPGARDPGVIAAICAGTDLPVNVMLTGEAASTVAGADVARISHGPTPYVEAMKGITARARAATL